MGVLYNTRKLDFKYFNMSGEFGGPSPVDMMMKKPENQEQRELVDILRERPITLYEEKRVITAAELKDFFAGKKVFACDFYVSDIEKNSQEIEGGFEMEGLANIDHHAPIEKMTRQVTSTDMAIEYVKKHGPISDAENFAVVVNHTDCDSVLSSAIMRGIIPPENRFSVAALAADHTGEADDVAELLQAFKDKRDLEFSIRNLDLFLQNKPLEPEAEELLTKRKNDRERAGQIIESGSASRVGHVVYIETSERIEAGLFAPLIPDAIVFVVSIPMKSQPGFFETKVRLGAAAPEGFTLRDLNMDEIDPNYGGRWNAGNNKRGGGTETTPQEYAERINRRIEEVLE